MDNHSKTGGKLDSKTDGPYEFPSTDGWTLLLDVDGSPYLVSRDHVTRAPPPSKRVLSRRKRAAVPWLSRQEGREHACVMFVDHARMEGPLYLRVRWFGFNPPDDTWEPSNRLVISCFCAYTRQSRIGGTPVANAGKILESDLEDDEKEGADRGLPDESSSETTDEEQEY